MLYAADFRARAREALNGNWGKAIGTGFVASLLGVGTTVAVSGGSSSGSDSSYGNSPGVSVGTDGVSASAPISFGEIDSIADLDGIIPTEFQVGFLVLLSVLSFIAIAFTVLHFVIGGAVTLGYVKFNLSLVDHKPASFAQLFSEFHRLGQGLLMQLLRNIYTFLWMLLFIIPGIYASYGYAMTPFILLENPDMTANEAIGKSKELMYGNRWRLFCLEISFIGWALLSAFTCGLGYIALYPYMEASYAAFYREITAEKYGREPKEEENEGFYYNGHIV